MLVSSSSAFPLDKAGFAKSATVTDQKGSIVARDFIVKLSNTYAYAVLGEQSPAIKNKAIRVEREDEESSNLKLVSIENEREDRRLLPVYVQFHYHPKERFADSHTLDLLAERVLGAQNLDLKKNVTIDLFEIPAHTRDESGFVVADKMQFVFESFNVPNLRNQLSPSKEAAIARFSSADIEELADYDKGVSGFDRIGYLEEMASQTSCFIARQSGVIVGVIFGRDGRVFSLFGDSRPIVDSLLDAFLSTVTSTTVSLFSPAGHFKGSLTSRNVFRRHSRVVPSAIDWSRIFSHNVGMSIV
ncbi:hypothetical protein PFISCL1PPCAC_14671 [Pristionchus fissidentatus]|uniref:DUF7596 domain-containing protein n=1 Tax=Pristionchus fissidentatus TaxID=1538716 RepID=A0AAV5VUZ5_9BILA|nr:hypothetical protein PFISCL1PPCAC_14671 [Pristionchus fissidentatus]